MPRVIAINILGFTLRGDSPDLLQPAKLMFTKAPARVASGKFASYSVQLPSVEKTDLDFGNPFHCWCYVLHTAHKGGLPVREVVEMGTPGLREFAAMDKGFQQFLSQYDYAANDPEVRRKYQDWYIELWRRQENERAAEERGVAIGEERGEKRGEERGIAIGAKRNTLEIARNMLRDGEPVEKIVRYTGLSMAEIKDLGAT